MHDDTSEPGCEPSTKTGREIARDLRRPIRSRGVLPAKFVRLVAFGVISSCIFACTAVCLLAVWDYADHDVAWRSLVSMGIITAAMGAFVVVNELFGSGTRDA